MQQVASLVFRVGIQQKQVHVSKCRVGIQHLEHSMSSPGRAQEKKALFLCRSRGSCAFEKTKPRCLHMAHPRWMTFDFKWESRHKEAWVS